MRAGCVSVLYERYGVRRGAHRICAPEGDVKQLQILSERRDGDTHTHQRMRGLQGLSRSAIVRSIGRAGSDRL